MKYKKYLKFIKKALNPFGKNSKKCRDAVVKFRESLGVKGWVHKKHPVSEFVSMVWLPLNYWGENAIEVKELDDLNIDGKVLLMQEPNEGGDYKDKYKPLKRAFIFKYPEVLTEHKIFLIKKEQ